MTSPFPKPGQRGFSLLEVLVAVVILSLGLLALASLQGALIRSATESKAQSLAMAIAKQKIEQLAAYQTLGGAGACVSPTDWNSTTAASCYRMITDEASTAVDGKPYTTAIEPMGGIAFFVATVVSRYVYNVNTNVYDLVTNANDTALDAALVTSPETLLPGKEFKRIVVDVTWTDATAVLRHVQVEDALNGIVPRDSIAIVNNRRGMTARYAESIVVDPGTIAGVIPIAVGNGSNTAASNPTPELKGRNDGTYVAETRFDVYTYIPLSGNKALAQSRVETAVVGCRCDTTTASTIEAPLRPTYWNGVRYVIPTKANYVGLTGSAPLANRPLAGPLALGTGDSQSDQCRVCCRDHHDPAGDDANTDSRSALAFYSPRRVGSDGADVGTDPDPAHTHYLVSNIADTRTLVASGPYSEVCRMIRVDGIFRVAADLHNDYYALLQARNSGASSFVPSDDVADDYGDMVKKYLGARVSDNTNAATYNNATSPADPYSVTYTQGSRTLPDTTTRTYDLNEPAAYPLELSDDAAWLHARGLYVDYMGPEAIARIEQAKTECPLGTDLNECVLPYLPFTSINLSELVAWKDEAITPDPAAFATVIKVLNNGFELATGDATFIETTGSGSSLTNPLRIDFSSGISGSILEGMAVSGTGIGDNAIVISITNGRRRVEVDVSNSATFSEGGNIVFQAAPIRGRVTPGTATADGYASNARATATYNNAAIALRFSMNPQEQALVATSNTDAQRFNMSGGSPPPPSNSFTVSTFTGYPGNPANQFFLAYGAGDVVASVGQPCSLTSVSNVNVLPFVCSPSSGLGGGMSILLSNYNFMDTTQTATTPIANCTNSDGKALLAGGGPVTYSPLLESPATSYSVKKCYNYAVSSATNVTPNPDVAGQFNQTVVSPGLLAEATPIYFNPISSDDDINIVFGTPTITTQVVTCTFTCSKATCATSGNKKTYYPISPNCP